MNLNRTIDNLTAHVPYCSRGKQNDSCSCSWTNFKTSTKYREKCHSNAIVIQDLQLNMCIRVITSVNRQKVQLFLSFISKLHISLRTPEYINRSNTAILGQHCHQWAVKIVLHTYRTDPTPLCLIDMDSPKSTGMVLRFGA